MATSFGGLVLELHGMTNTDAAGTFMKSVGERPSIRYVAEAEELLRQEMGIPWRRAYLRAADGILAIYTRQGPTVKFLVRSRSYDGTIALRFVGSVGATVAVEQWEDVVGDSTVSIHTQQEAETWARERLQVAASAVLMNRGAVRAAYEMVAGRMELISRGPRTTRR